MNITAGLMLRETPPLPLAGVAWITWQRHFEALEYFSGEAEFNLLSDL